MFIILIIAWKLLIIDTKKVIKNDAFQGIYMKL